MAAFYLCILSLLMIEIIIPLGVKSTEVTSKPSHKVSPVTLGIETAGGLLVPLIKRNSSIPNRQSKTFSTYNDKQTDVVLDIYEGERILAKDNHLIGKLILTHLHPAPRGVPQIKVTFDVDADGVLNVSAVEKSTGKVNSVQIGYNESRLTEREVQWMLKEAEKHKHDDKKHKERIEAKHELESYVYGMKRKVERGKSGHEIKGKKKHYVIGKYNETLKWLKENPLAEKDEIVSKHNNLKMFWSVISSNVNKG